MTFTRFSDSQNLHQRSVTLLRNNAKAF
jgi:hypothetical protein